MDKNKSKTFTTGEFAQRFGIKKDTLFYYDRIGLFHPAGVNDNGYRYYTVPQLDVFWMLQSLRELNFPLKTLKHYVNAPSPEELIALSKEQLSRVKQEIRKLEQIHWLLSSIVTYSEEALSAPLDEISLIELPAEPILYSNPIPKENDIASGEEWFSYYDRFLKETELKGPAYVGSIVSQKDLLAGRFEKVDRLFVRMDNADAKLKPAGLYAVTYHKGPYESVLEIYEPFLRQLKEQGLTVCGDAYEEYLLGKLSTQNQTDFIFKISLAVHK
ncbi:MerR family transcriptional regulator [Tissierella sp. MSJ-40]|uniref:MerR family transcriptional regulator n=1 Tax=Tissierella simiarum TaxID=2841534 RepID=A0ABS6E9C5_9FIRM|nr:MerR family transcriptional regulator [Tissierella simiarum]MBU5439537.1 MerR family transcriptional regulator [Tissierella simiarum]